MSSGPDAHWIVVEGDASESWRTASVRLTRCLAARASPGAARIVCFASACPPGFEGDDRCKLWREALDYPTYVRLWAEAYDRVKGVSCKLSEEWAQALELDVHSLADVYLKLLAIEYLKSVDENVILVVSSELDRAWCCGYHEPTTEKWALFGATRFGLKYRLRDVWYFAHSQARQWVRSAFRGMYAVWRECHDLAKVAGKIWQLRTLRTPVVLCVEDSGTGVNLNPALEIIAAFERRGERVLVLTSRDTIAGRVHEATRSQALSLQNGVFDTVGRALLHWRHAPPLLKPRNPAAGSLTQVELAFLHLFYERRGSLRSFGLIVEFILNRLQAVCGPIKAVLAVYEVLPLSIACGRWATEKGVPWVGFFPILVGERPDAHAFPAHHHLVYGEQLRDLIVADGHPASCVTVVGSPTYDAFLRRDRVSDRATIERSFPGSRGKKVLVVATEAFADPMTELGPILGAVAGMPGVHVVLKLHPEDSMEFFTKVVSELPRNHNIDVVKQTDLGSLLGGADLLVCIVSNIIVSAAVIGTPTLVCDFSGKTKVLDFVKEGLSVGCSDPARVKSAIEELLFDPVKRGEMLDLLKQGQSRFNGPNDGRSVERIVDFVLDHAGAGMPEKRLVGAAKRGDACVTAQQN